MKQFMESYMALLRSMDEKIDRIGKEARHEER